MLNMDRAEKLTRYLTSDPENAKALLALETEKALVKINANGYDFSIDELEEYCKAFKAAVLHNSSENGELSVEDMENVAGGVVLTTGMVLGLVGCFAGGTAIGIAFGAKW